MPTGLCHFELVTADTARCKDFYGQVFGWQFDDQRMPGYTLIQTGQEPSGGIMPHTQPDKSAAPGLNAYFNVEDLDACLEKVVEHGGRILVNKTPIPNVGNLAVFSDPEGITIGVMQPT